MKAAIINTKGGVSKTTTAVYLATALAAHARVLALDADQQGSLTEWHMDAADTATPLPFDVQPTNAMQLRRGSLGAGYDHVIIDTPPGHGEILQAAEAAADLVIIPTKPGPLDVRRAWATLDAVRDTPAVVLLTDVERDTYLARESLEAFEADDTAVILDATIPHRQAIKKSAGERPRDLHGYGAVAAEILDLMTALTKETTR